MQHKNTATIGVMVAATLLVVTSAANAAWLTPDSETDAFWETIEGDTEVPWDPDTLQNPSHPLSVAETRNGSYPGDYPFQGAYKVIAASVPVDPGETVMFTPDKEPGAAYDLYVFDTGEYRKMRIPIQGPWWDDVDQYEPVIGEDGSISVTWTTAPPQANVRLVNAEAVGPSTVCDRSGCRTDSLSGASSWSHPHAEAMFYPYIPLADEPLTGLTFVWVADMADLQAGGGQSAQVSGSFADHDPDAVDLQPAFFVLEGSLAFLLLVYAGAAVMTRRQARTASTDPDDGDPDGAEPSLRIMARTEHYLTRLRTTTGFAAGAMVVTGYLAGLQVSSQLGASSLPGTTPYLLGALFATGLVALLWLIGHQWLHVDRELRRLRRIGRDLESIA